ncbi:PorT family protein [Flavobacterium silvisoli]|uniref:PorT family protein n=1 Tax=Flavobacterium silvisoli TaxID=2529433 RepID=A0A4Q9Z711_9FLAO|nr:outer membrane beta-barrel protein [Flavobacterium silvisoli]TBX71276.1 PorT family protein [Flavobacterium silvisoli]
MSERKNIDRLFQEKFKDFEANPADEVWENIEAKLNEKKKRRIIPFWWKSSGVAALFVLGFLLTKSVYSPNNQTKDAVVGTNAVPAASEASTPKVIENRTTIKQPGPTSSEAIVNNSSSAPEKSETSSDKVITIPKNNSKTIVTHFQKALVENNSDQIHSSKKKRQNRNSDALVPETIVEKTSEKISQSEENNSVALAEKEHTEPKFTPNNSNNVTALTGEKPLNLDSLKEAITSNSKIVTPEKKVNDTVKIAGVATNELEELLNEKESKEKQLPKENRWQITSNVAPVFLGSVGNGSPIGSEFENNSKEYNTSFSMGVGVSYAVNTKLSVRTGINKMSVDYNTNNIAFFVAIDDQGMNNISPTLGGKTIHVEDAETPVDNLLPFENNFVQRNEGYMNQKMGYYEVPVELTYALINNRFGVKVIGGVSTFFLNENKISLVSENMSTELGKANNLNDVHFSTNLGLGIKYGFLKSFEFNVEPTVKYQLNTFTKNAGNFKPYFFGIYSGISYKF